ncbi:Abortive infection protein [Beutenbergia cavernae DSM 12333]|uniref:Abortive infection protein n=1 Tax=Beutenbergia cavernae (strain ATCC BAA-8 / DSM 12333 / CCUG 43141 / JCM 11478 / NBRC 16432 / NCIMB 13614 / HKI 0122) TaxID=471853 RepID=C5C274_BEUC1|nr:CPBP family intramembrane glutamic endopeptidase [Beutenbergia cavernae]ACQ81699.1 Abortive infection protein [Beutenbergia cavernae DSM 12333]
MTEVTGSVEEASPPASAWQRFWDRGGWWRALLLAVLYIAVFLGVSAVVGTLGLGPDSLDEVLESAGSVFFGLLLPILVMGLLLLVFLATVGWRREVFGPQPVSGRPWMWIAVVLVLVPIVVHVVGTSWASYDVTVVLTVLALGLCIGLAEEVLTRGIAVRMLRSAGYGEKVVMVLSSALFALLHASNLTSGQEITTVGVTLVYAFGFGTMMYLSMRVTGSIVPAILLHAATDPTTFLATGGVDSTGAHAGSEALNSLAGSFNGIFVVVAIVAIFLVRGRASSDHQRRAG